MPGEWKQHWAIFFSFCFIFSVMKQFCLRKKFSLWCQSSMVNFFYNCRFFPANLPKKSIYFSSYKYIALQLSSPPHEIGSCYLIGTKCNYIFLVFRQFSGVIVNSLNNKHFVMKFHYESASIQIDVFFVCLFVVQANLLRIAWHLVTTCCPEMFPVSAFPLNPFQRQ